MSSQKQEKRAVYILLALMIVSITVKCIATSVGKTYLYADGAAFFYALLRGDGYKFAHIGRQGSYFLMQLFAGLALRAGVTDINLLGTLFSIGEVFWFGAFTFLAMLLCKKYHREGYIPLLAVNYAVVNIFSGFFIEIESITAVGIYIFLLMYYLLSCKKEAWLFRVIAALLLLVLPHGHEYFIGYSIVLLCVLFSRLLRERDKIYPIEWFVHIAMNVYYIYSAYMAIMYGDATTGSVINSIKSLPEKKYFWLLIFGIAIFVLALLVYDKFHNKTIYAAAVAVSILCIVWLGYLVCTISDTLAVRSFSMRFINFIIPSALGMFCLLVWLLRINYNIEYSLTIMAAAFLIISNVYDIKTSNAYHDYIVSVNQKCQERTGFFTIDESGIDRTYCWGWPLPLESLLAQCLMGETVIDSVMIEYFDKEKHVLIDSSDIDAYMDMSGYGIVIDKQSFY